MPHPAVGTQSLWAPDAGHVSVAVTGSLTCQRNPSLWSEEPIKGPPWTEEYGESPHPFSFSLTLCPSGKPMRTAMWQPRKMQLTDTLTLARGLRKKVPGAEEYPRRRKLEEDPLNLYESVHLLGSLQAVHSQQPPKTRGQGFENGTSTDALPKARPTPVRCLCRQSPTALPRPSSLTDAGIIAYRRWGRNLMTKEISKWFHWQILSNKYGRIIPILHSLFQKTEETTLSNSFYGTLPRSCSWCLHYPTTKIKSGN